MDGKQIYRDIHWLIADAQTVFNRLIESVQRGRAEDITSSSENLIRKVSELQEKLGAKYEGKSK